MVVAVERGNGGLKMGGGGGGGEEWKSTQKL